MKLKVNLHAHSSESPDACLSPRELATHFRDHGFDVIAITDHGRVTEPPDVKGITVLKGIERSVGDDFQHLLEYPDHDLRILPHPNVGGFTGGSLQAAIDKYQVQGVEKYNRGLQTALHRDIPDGTFYVSQSDFHHPGDETAGHFWLRAPSRAAEHVVSALKSPNAMGRITNVRTHSPIDLPAVSIASLFNMMGVGQRFDRSNVSKGEDRDRFAQVFRQDEGCPECGDKSEGVVRSTIG